MRFGGLGFEGLEDELGFGVQGFGLRAVVAWM